MTKAPPDPEYSAFLASLKDRVLQARTSAIRAVNRELVFLYWDIGRGIVEKQKSLGWGEAVVDRLSSDLRNPIWPQAEAKMEENGDPVETLSQLLMKIPWGHHRLILDKMADSAARFYYIWATWRSGWSRNVLLNQIKAGAYERAAVEKKTHNFGIALPEHLAEQADEMMKSRYNLEFLDIILCAEKDDVEVEFALKTKTNPIGVAEYQLQPSLPAVFKGRLPSARQQADAVRDAMAQETQWLVESDGVRRHRLGGAAALYNLHSQKIILACANPLVRGAKKRLPPGLGGVYRGLSGRGDAQEAAAPGLTRGGLNRVAVECR